MILVAVLAAVAMPKFDAALGLRSDAWRDEVVSALRHAHQTAVSHRRLVCAVVGSTSVTLTIAANNPATTCGSSLPGPDGGSAYTTSTGGTTASLSPAGTLYFQPNGRVTSDGAGSTASDRSITIGSTSIVVVGETGHVR
ncbi:pilus assembly FimT family protein [Ideonella sp. BN130291]|uniref:pilus assembly FimT family protein n=1 Tax=Ideonella sp. BN130291 TaxID=3112940 RepID=UPI002E271AEA|nr:type II secretion system protein [Ideonella sp. BN130291]